MTPRILLVLLLSACGGATATHPETDLSSSDGMSGGVCAPGAVQSCNCLGAGSGFQTCRASGQSFGPCVACSDGGTTTMSTDLAVTSGSPCGDCDGCCNGTTCVAIGSQDTNECGTRATCAACTSGDSCTNGVCTPPSMTQTCSGCPYYGTLCESGQCSTDIDPNAMFKMYVKEIVLAPTDGGYAWDPPEDKAPDPFVCVTFTYNGTTQTGCNKYCDTQYDCIPGSGDNLVGNSDGSTTATSPLYIPGAVFTSGGVGMQITVYDYDEASSNDTAGQGTFTTPSYVRPYTVNAFQNVTKLVFELD